MTTSSTSDPTPSLLDESPSRKITPFDRCHMAAAAGDGHGGRRRQKTVGFFSDGGDGSSSRWQRRQTTVLVDNGNGEWLDFFGQRQQRMAAAAGDGRGGRRRRGIFSFPGVGGNSRWQRRQRTAVVADAADISGRQRPDFFSTATATAVAAGGQRRR